MFEGCRCALLSRLLRRMDYPNSIDGGCPIHPGVAALTSASNSSEVFAPRWTQLIVVPIDLTIIIAGPNQYTFCTLRPQFRCDLNTEATFISKDQPSLCRGLPGGWGAWGGPLGIQSISRNQLLNFLRDIRMMLAWLICRICRLLISAMRLPLASNKVTWPLIVSFGVPSSSRMGSEKVTFAQTCVWPG